MSERVVKSFKAVIVLTRHDGIDPALEDVEIILGKAGLAYGMPGQPDAPVVISLNDQGVSLPLREKVSCGTEAVLEPEARLEKEKASKES